MTFLEVYAVAGLAILAMMLGLWLISLALKDAGIVDVFWGTGFIAANWICFALTPDGFPARKLLMAVLVTAWGLRLSLHILRRNWGKPEDFRYKKWRDEAGASWWWKSLFKVFLLQGFLMWVISSPLLAVHISTTTDRLTIIDGLGVVLWGIGFFFEAVGDWQLARFKADPVNKGRLMRSGLWRYTRHPNYFGDAVQWWGYYILAAVAGGWWTIFSPIIMTVLLVRISGVAMLEKTLKETRPSYREYIETTSAFVPWFPRQKRLDPKGS